MIGSAANMEAVGAEQDEIEDLSPRPSVINN